MTNSKIKYPTSFNAIVVSDKNLTPVAYNLDMCIRTITNDITKQNIAIRRVDFLIHEIFNNSVFVEMGDTKRAAIVETFPRQTIIDFPEVCFDQLVGMILFNKISAIIEEVYEIETLTITSSQCRDNELYIIDDFVEFEQYGALDNWWDSSDMRISDAPNELSSQLSWDDVDLGWDQDLSDDSFDVIFIPDTPSTGNTKPDIFFLSGDTAHSVSEEFENMKSGGQPPDKPSGDNSGN